MADADDVRLLEAVGHEATHFVEYKEAVELVATIVAADFAQEGDQIGSHEEGQPAQTVTTFLAETPLLGKTDVSSNNTMQLLSIASRFEEIMNKYQEQPHLLDPHLDDIVQPMMAAVRDEDTPMTKRDLVYRLLYCIIKVRGHKAMVKRLSHQANDLHFVLSSLERENPQEHSIFDEESETIPQRIIKLIKVYLSSSDASRDAAAILCGRFLTRPDMQTNRLGEFISWMKSELPKTRDAGHLFQVSGIMSSIASIFKLGKREILIEHVDGLLDLVLQSALLNDPSILTRKLAVKVTQRIGLVLLKPKVATWRYQRGKRALARNLDPSAPGADCVTESPAIEAGGDSSDDFWIPEAVESIIDILIKGLKDKDTVVRWSAAKGIGRITGRLPLVLADEVVEAVLELVLEHGNDNAWHGACLALAELGRRGLLLPARLSDVIPILSRALAFDVFRGTTSVGAHVRDAACYVCWAFARAYSPEVLEVYIHRVTPELLVTSLFDRETNVRRAAAAAFQENVGRLGTVPNGIDIIAAADYFAVGNRSNSYTTIAKFVAQFEEYQAPLINHLADSKLGHWDELVRYDAAHAMHQLALVCPDHVVCRALPILTANLLHTDLNVRHGSAIAIGQIVLGLGKRQAQHQLHDNFPELYEKLWWLVDDLEQRSYLKGMGGAILRIAICDLIRDLAASNFALPKQPEEANQVVLQWFSFVAECLAHADENLQSHALCAWESLCCTFVERNPHFFPVFWSSVCEPIMKQLRSPVNALSPSYTRLSTSEALGHAAVCLEQEKRLQIQNALIAASQVADGIECLALPRAFALKGLAILAESDTFASVLEVEAVFDAFLVGLKDYSIDSHGDIGSKVRSAAMKGLSICFVQWLNQRLLPVVKASLAISELLKQSVEKIDRIRKQAGSLLQALLKELDTSGHLDSIADGHNLLQHLSNLPSDFDWNSGHAVFQALTPLLQYNAYRTSLLKGLILSMGGLTESLVLTSRHAVLNYIRHSSHDAVVELFSELISIGKDNVEDSRVSLPFLESTHFLLTQGAFDCLEMNPLFDDLVTTVRQIAKGSTNVKLLSCSVQCLSELIIFRPSHKKALASLSMYLCHRFPKVRSATASSFYLALLSSSEAHPLALEVLKSNDWRSIDIGALREQRNMLCDIFDVPKPKAKGGTRRQATSAQTTELDSYKDLVERAGY